MTSHLANLKVCSVFWGYGCVEVMQGMSRASCLACLLLSGDGADRLRWVSSRVGVVVVVEVVQRKLSLSLFLYLCL